MIVIAVIAILAAIAIPNFLSYRTKVRNVFEISVAYSTKKEAYLDGRRILEHFSYTTIDDDKAFCVYTEAKNFGWLSNFGKKWNVSVKLTLTILSLRDNKHGWKLTYDIIGVRKGSEDRIFFIDDFKEIKKELEAISNTLKKKFIKV